MLRRPHALAAMILALLAAPAFPVLAGGGGDYPPPVSGDWVITQDTWVENETINFTGNLIVQSGILSLKDCFIGGKADDIFYVNVSESAVLVADNCTFADADTYYSSMWLILDGIGRLTDCCLTSDGVAYINNTDCIIVDCIVDSFFIIEEGLMPDCRGTIFQHSPTCVWMKRNSSLSGATIRSGFWAGVEAESNTTISDCQFLNCSVGVDTRSDNTTILNSSFSDCAQAIWGRHYDNLHVSGCRIAHCTEGVVSSGEKHIVRDTVIASTIKPFVVDHGSISAINVTADQSGSQVASDGSLEVAWYLDTTVIYPNVTPADGAGLLISDRNGNLLSSIKSGPDGRTPRQEITEYIRTWNSTAYFTPLSLNASKDGLARNLSVNLNQNLDLTLTLGDVTAPSVRFASPANNTLLNRTSFRFTGTASDDQGVASVRLRAGSGEWVTAGGTTEWNATLDLLEGENLIVAEASDAEGNTALAFLSVRVDSLPPVVEITSPAPGLLVNTTSVELSGRTEPGCTVLVQGEAAPFYLGQFSATVALQEGPNTIVVSARDAGGNVGAASVNITRDTIAPSLTLTAPRNGEITGRAIVKVSGTAEATAALFVNEALLPRSGAFFAVEVMLSDGVNNVSVRAVDAAGNQATILARVILDRTPPPITLELKNGTISQVALLTVAGRTEPGAALSVNGVPVAVAGDGNFSTKVSLRPGPNQIRVEATDPFGNPASLDRTVTYEQPARPKPPVVGEPEPTINPAIPVGIGIIIGFVLMAALLFRGRPPVPAGDDRKSGSLPSGREP